MSKAKEVGRTVIITNARKTWVEYSGQNLLPLTNRELEYDISLISARDDFEHRVKTPEYWKHHAFLSMMTATKNHGQLIHSDTIVNLVVVGDSLYEMEAALALSHELGAHRCLLKTVKLTEQPSP